jgi:hypothetical protein
LTSKSSIVPTERVERAILVIRGQKVMLDVDLAVLYGVPTRTLNQAVKRNKDRFPSDFMFCLSRRERQEVITKCDHLQKLKFSPALPHAFTEHGAIMVASVLNTPRAIEVSVYVVRAFIKLREILPAHRELSRKIKELERRLGSHDEQIQTLFEAIRQLMAPVESRRRRIGFQAAQPG